MTLHSETMYFPKTEDLMQFPYEITIGGFPISVFGICLVAAFLIGIVEIRLEAGRKKKKFDEFVPALALMIIFGVICSRVVYVLFHMSYFIHHPLWILNIHAGGLSFYGALLGAYLALRRYGKVMKCDYKPMADIICKGASLSAALVWLGCFLLQEPLGKAYTGRFSIAIPMEKLQERIGDFVEKEHFTSNCEVFGKPAYGMFPVAMTGMILAVILAIVLEIMKSRITKDGLFFEFYLFLNACMMLVLSLLSRNSGNLLGQWLPPDLPVSVALIALTCLNYAKRHRKKRPMEVRVHKD